MAPKKQVWYLDLLVLLRTTTTTLQGSTSTYRSLLHNNMRCHHEAQVESLAETQTHPHFPTEAHQLPAAHKFHW
ncbi:hypothetical protein V8C37DRAFT_378282 [Trichoderma ceciliae]